MIGLVYADCRDATFSDSFHRYVCGAFQSVNLKHPASVVALTDPGVTSLNISLLLAICDFVFYWGHGRYEDGRDFMVLGSTEQELMPFNIFTTMLDKKAAYFDACGLGTYLKEQAVGECTIACPIGSVDYDTSVKVGCTTMLGLFGNDNMTFSSAFQRAIELTSIEDAYILFNSSVEVGIDVADDVKLSLVECFSDILKMWLQRK